MQQATSATGRNGTAQRSRFLCTILFLLAGTAQAHSRFDVRVQMTPPAIPGVVVELHQDVLAPQLVIENRSGKPVEILDAEGRAFLRIGPRQAEADVATAAFHQSRVSGGATAPAGTLSKKPRWRVVNREPSYGWFDPRIAIAALDIPYAVRETARQSGQELPFGEWRVPVRIGDEKYQLEGLFVHTPVPKGAARSRLLSPAEPAPGISVQLAPGTVPALMLSNKGKEPVTILDERGQGFLRIGPDGVWGNVDRPALRATTSEPLPKGTGWQRLSRARSHVWLEPRARYSGPPPQGGQPVRLNEWTIPLQQGERRLELRGANDWQPAPAEPERKK